MRRKQRAKAILTGNDACARAVYEATKLVLGDRFESWEPETIRMELDDRDIDIYRENFDALMAVVTLRTTTDFWWDAIAFENICVALNGKSPHLDIFHNTAPAQIAWAVEAAHDIVESSDELMLPDDMKPDERFDYEPIEYTAGCCLEYGMAVVPSELGFARERLEELTKADDELISKVKKAWSEMDHSRLQQHAFGENAVDVQLALMAAVRTYVQDKRKCLDEQRELLD